MDAKYPRDRVVWNQVARLQFLKRNYEESIDALKKVAEIDPEDLQMHYTAMLAYRGIGDIASAEREQKLFQRFKADESSQAITAKRRCISPEDNNERQQIHDHESVDLNGPRDHRVRRRRGGGSEPETYSLGAAAILAALGIAPRPHPPSPANKFSLLI